MKTFLRQSSLLQRNGAVVYKHVGASAPNALRDLFAERAALAEEQAFVTGGELAGQLGSGRRIRGEGYTQFFGTAAQPRLPVRSAFQIAALGNPGWLIEIEVTAVRKKK